MDQRWLGVTEAATKGQRKGLLDSLRFARVLSSPARLDSDESPLWRATLAGLLDAGVQNRPVGAFWGRRKAWEPLEVLIAGVISPEHATESSEAPLLFPLGATGMVLPEKEVSDFLDSFDAWLPCLGLMDALGLDDERQRRLDESHPYSAFDDVVGYLAHQAFCWAVACTPSVDGAVQKELGSLRREIFRLKQTGGRSEVDAVELERKDARFRELAAAGSHGVWDVHIAAGASDAASVGSIASILCSAAERAVRPYRLRPTSGRTATSLSKLFSATAVTTDLGSHPFMASSELVASLVRPPEVELPGIRVVLPPTFDTTLERSSDGGHSISLGGVLDRHLRHASPFEVSLETLNRHAFVCGATGSGKSQTIRGLLEELSRVKRPHKPVPWLVIEPAKAEYARMAGRLSDIAEVLTIAPGDRVTAPGSLNPLEPASLERGNPDRTFPLQSHADLIRALFLAAFRSDEPFPQVLSAALTDCYERAGWDLVTGEPLFRWDDRTGQPKAVTGTAVPRYPRLRDLQEMAKAVVEQIGYDRETTQRVKGFVDVRIGSLRLGTPGRFFEGGHPLDFGALLRQNVVFALEGVTNDQDKAFLMGAVLIRLYEQLLLEERERFAHDGGPAPFRHLTIIEEAHRLLRNFGEESPAAHSVELFASLLAEVRAYGEGIVIAEQIPSKLIADAIKNTALKVMHRLPALDDRETVGATMNLSSEESTYVVTLKPGVAAVFADGMDRPLLARMQPGEDREDASEVCTVPPFASDGRRSRACGAECRSERPCLLTEIRKAERLLEEQPLVTLWLEVAVIRHLMGRGAPLFASSAELDVLRSSNPRLTECAIAHAVEASVSSRYDALKAFFDPEAFGAHLAAAAGHAVLPDQHASDVCRDDKGDWQAGSRRFADIEWLLGQAKATGKRGALLRAEARGLEIRGSTSREQLAYLRSLAWKRYSPTQQFRLLFGTTTPSPLLTVAGELAKPGSPRNQLLEALRLLQWRGEDEAKLREMISKEALAEP
jgi:DNA helicase HerA-like ATPase